jgi:peptide/nickel transport system substrate-binding protein
MPRTGQEADGGGGAQLALDVVRPVIHHNVRGTCWHPYVKGCVLHRNSAYNNWRLEDVWLDQ